MNERGVTLMELIIVIAIMMILATLSTIAFKQYTEKANVESMVRTLYADLMDVRSQSIMQRDTRQVIVSPTGLTVFNGAKAMIYKSKGFNFPVQFSSVYGIVDFDTNGMASPDLPAYTTLPFAICVYPAGTPLGGTGAQVDAVVISQTLIQMGKVTGGGCSSDKITIQ